MEAAMAVSDISATTMGLNASDPMAQRLADDYRREMEHRMEHVSPLGTMNLPALLDERRVGHAVPDSAFRLGPLFDQVVLWPLEEADLGDGKISEHLFAAPSSRSNDELKSPRCLILDAGVLAIDQLRSNGADIGHIVYIIHLNPWWIPCGRSKRGKDWYVRLVTADRVVGSEDFAREKREGKVRIVEDAQGRACIERDGKRLSPIQPTPSPDY